MKGIMVFKNVDDARAEGFEIYDNFSVEYIVVWKATPSGRAFAIALREVCGCAPQQMKYATARRSLVPHGTGV